MSRGLPAGIGRGSGEPVAPASPQRKSAATPGPAADSRAPYARLAVVGLIRRDGGPAREAAWLLLHRFEPEEAWDPPGGRMEEGEGLSAAVVREVAEETGLAVRVAGPCYALLDMYKGERLLAVSMACRAMGEPDGVELEAGGATEWRWSTAGEWEELAAAGRSTWSALEVRRATRMATVLLEMEGE
jgi:ADP-ribose pyrophosphatase YjhB (NUDIX family)